MQKWKASWLLGTYLTECADPTTHVAVGNTLNSISEINSVIFYCWFSVFKENLYIDTNPITNIIYIQWWLGAVFMLFIKAGFFFSQWHGAEQNNLWWWMHWIELQSYVNRADSAYNLLLWNESHLLNDVQRCLSLYFPDGPLHLLFIYFSHKTLLHL